MFTKNMYIIFFIVHALGTHTFVNGMNPESGLKFEDKTKVKKPFYVDDLRKGPGIYDAEESDPYSKEFSNNTKSSYQEVKKEDKIAYVYFHGFGEIGDLTRGPVFPDGGLNFGKAAFFTQRNVSIAAQYLKQKVVVEKHNILHLEGKSMGASILINCLENLIQFTQYSTFKNTGITEDDARNILAAVNRGKISLSTPALNMEKTCIVAFYSKCASYATILGFFGLLTYTKYLQKFLGNTIESTTIYGILFTTMLATMYIFSRKIENHYARLIDQKIIPIITCRNYNPYYQKPIDAAFNVAHYLHCPVLIHVSRNDGILKNPDSDMITFYQAFKNRKNSTETHFLLSNDDTHDTNNEQYNNIKRMFFNCSSNEFKNTETNIENENFNTLNNDKVWLKTESAVYQQINTLKQNSVTEFFNLGRSVFQLLGRL